jgi:DNA-binding transcriptional regulator LsrR (DeoR family)
MSTPIGTKIRIIKDLYDSDEMQVLVEKDTVTEITGEFDDLPIIDIDGCTISIDLDEFEVIDI